MSAAFRRTVRNGRRAGSAALVLHLGAAPTVEAPAPPRVGFVVGRQVGPAVVRNRVRRRLRHVTLDSLQRLPESTDLVVRALPPAAGMSSEELRAELGRCLDRVLVTG